MTNEGIKHQLKVLLTQIDKHLEAAEKGIHEDKLTQAEADIFQSREHTRQSMEMVGRITN
jgi:hypothetical protein